jgi:hypothetical protein
VWRKLEIQWRKVEICWRKKINSWMARDLHGKLGKNNAGRLADTLQARAPPLLPVAIWTLTRIEC